MTAAVREPLETHHLTYIPSLGKKGQGGSRFLDPTAYLPRISGRVLKPLRGLIALLVAWYRRLCSGVGAMSLGRNFVHSSDFCQLFCGQSLSRHHHSNSPV
jgi:hypothetical protein